MLDVIIAAQPLPRCPVCGEEWPVTNPPLTFRQWSAAWRLAERQLGEPRCFEEAAHVAELASTFFPHAHFKACGALVEVGQ